MLAGMHDSYLFKRTGAGYRLSHQAVTYLIADSNEIAVHNMMDYDIENRSVEFTLNLGPKIMPGARKLKDLNDESFDWHRKYHSEMAHCCF